MNEEVREIELIGRRAMLYLPENTVHAELTLQVYEDGELIKVIKTLNLSDLRRAFEDAEHNYIEDDDRFVLTEKGMRDLES